MLMFAPKRRLAAVQRVLRPFAVVDVDEEAPARVLKRKTPRLKPTIGAIETSKTKLHFEGFTGRNGLGEEFDGAWTIFRMNRGARYPVF